MFDIHYLPTRLSSDLCQQWNTFVEEFIQKDTKKNINDWQDYSTDSASKKTQLLQSIKTNHTLRLVTHHQELNRVLRSEEHTSELQSPCNLVCSLLLEN